MEPELTTESKTCSGAAAPAHVVEILASRTDCKSAGFSSKAECMHRAALHAASDTAFVVASSIPASTAHEAAAKLNDEDVDCRN